MVRPPEQLSGSGPSHVTPTPRPSSVAPSQSSSRKLHTSTMSVVLSLMHSVSSPPPVQEAVPFLHESLSAPSHLTPNGSVVAGLQSLSNPLSSHVSRLSLRMDSPTPYRLFTCAAVSA